MFGYQDNKDVAVAFGGLSGTTFTVNGGIQSFNISQAAQNNIVRPFGYSSGILLDSSYPQVNLSYSAAGIEEVDLTSLQTYTGVGVYHNNTYRQFVSGYMTNYSLNVGVGNLPQVSVTAALFGEIEPFTQTATAVNKPQPISMGDILISGDNIASNRVISFSYSARSDINVKHICEGNGPICRVYRWPKKEFDAQIELEVDDAFLTGYTNFLEEKHDKSVALSITGREIVSIPRASLVSDTVVMDDNGICRLTLGYKGHE